MRVAGLRLLGVGTVLAVSAACDERQTLLGEADRDGEAAIEPDVPGDPTDRTDPGPGGDADGPDGPDAPDARPDVDDDVPDALDGPDLPVGPDVDAPDVGPEGDGRDAFPDPGPPDPWVPEWWDVRFEYPDYADVPADFDLDALLCGDGMVTPGEECDDGNTNDNDECTNDCRFPRCGDGIIWHGWEDCDPPGTVRPCATSCGTTGGEWCDAFCQWTGECVAPREACGNDVDDDCDGVSDLIVREAGNVAVSDRPILSPETRSRVAWTGGEFAVVWQSYLRTVVLTRVDRWGRRVDWDTDLLDAPLWVHDLGWTGAFLSLLWEEEREPEPGHTYGVLGFEALDRWGSAASPPAILAGGAGPACCEYPLLAASPEGHAVVRLSPADVTPSTNPHYSFWHISPDGSSVSDEATLGDYGRVRPYCLAWTGSEYALVLTDADVMGGTDEKRIDFISSAGTIVGSVVADLEPYATVFACTWTGTGLAVLLEDSGYLTLAVLAADGSLAGSEPIIGSGLFSGDDRSNHSTMVVSTGSELGLVWNDDRSGNGEVYFVRASADDGHRLTEDARVTRTPYESANPSLAWTGGSWGVVWNDSDGVDSGTYFTHFSVCP